MVINGIDLEKSRLIGTVLVVDSANRKLGVYIPKLMPAIDGSIKKSYNVATNNGIELPKLNNMVSTTVNKTNYIWVRNWDSEEAMPDVDSKVEVVFIDGDIRQAFWKKFNPNGDYKVIESEKYPAYSTLSITNGKTGVSETIKKDDIIAISIPDYFTINKTEDGKTHNFLITETAIANINETINAMQNKLALLSTRAITQDYNDANDIDISAIPTTDAGYTTVNNYRLSALNIIGSTNDINEADEALNLAINKIGVYLYSYKTHSELSSAYTSAITDETVKTYLTNNNITSASIESDYTEIKAEIDDLYDAYEAKTKYDKFKDIYKSSYNVNYLYYVTPDNAIVETPKSKTVSKGAFTAYSSTDEPTECKYRLGYAAVKLMGWKENESSDGSIDSYLFRDINLAPKFDGLYVPITSVVYGLTGTTIASATLNIVNDTNSSYTLQRSTDSGTTWQTVELSGTEWKNDIADPTVFNATSTYEYQLINSASSVIAILKLSDLYTALTTTIN